MKLKDKIVIVTGAGKGIGRATAELFAKEGAKVLADHPCLTQVKADIRDKSKLIEASKGCDALIHLACISNDPSYDLNPNLGKSINYDAFFNIVDAMNENKIKRLIYASSSSVFGLKSEKNVTEEATLEPLTDYSKFKVACEKILRELKDPEFDWVVVRPATVCGFAPRLRLDVVVNILAIHALVNKKIKIFGGDQLRPNINIKDMTRIYQLMLSGPAEKVKGEIFNAGYQNYPVRKIAEIVRDTCNDPAIDFEVVPTDDNRSYHINSDKLKRLLGFSAKFTIEQAVQSLIDAYTSGLIKDPFNNSMYSNIKRMKEIELK